MQLLNVDVDVLLLLCVALKQDLARKHKEALQSCKSHNLALLKSNQQAEQEVRHWHILIPLSTKMAMVIAVCFLFFKQLCVVLSGSGNPCARGAKNDG